MLTAVVLLARELEERAELALLGTMVVELEQTHAFGMGIMGTLRVGVHSLDAVLKIRRETLGRESCG